MSQKLEIEFNDEVLTILDTLHPTNRDTAVNYAISSLLVKTKIFQEFFLRPEHRIKDPTNPLEVVPVDDGNSVVDNSDNVSKKVLGPAITSNQSSTMSHRDVGVTNTPQEVVVVKKPTTSWDSF